MTEYVIPAPHLTEKSLNLAAKMRLRQKISDHKGQPRNQKTINIRLYDHYVKHYDCDDALSTTFPWEIYTPSHTLLDTIIVD